MSVVQRCPSCGTTQATAGECETCHEARVRYFCTNHEPGVWLAGPTCPQCEARAAPAARPIESPDLRPSRKARSDAPVGRAVPVRAAIPAAKPSEGAKPSEREPVSPSPSAPWLKQLAVRLLLIAVAIIVALGVAVYLVARSLH